MKQRHSVTENSSIFTHKTSLKRKNTVAGVTKQWRSWTFINCFASFCSQNFIASVIPSPDFPVPDQLVSESGTIFQPETNFSTKNDFGEQPRMVPDWAQHSVSGKGVNKTRNMYLGTVKEKLQRRPPGKWLMGFSVDAQRSQQTDVWRLVRRYRGRVFLYNSAHLNPREPQSSLKSRVCAGFTSHSTTGEKKTTPIVKANQFHILL